MKVYAESNFVLELVLDQEQRVACERLIELAEARRVELVLPSYALLEPHDTLVRKTSEWKRLGNDVHRELVQLRRSNELAGDAAAVTDLMTKAVRVSHTKHDEVRAKLLTLATLLPIDAATLREADRLRAETSLLLPDAVMLASVLLDARPSEPSLFLNRNTSDFADPVVRDALGAKGAP